MISVIIPCYNAHLWLPETLDSLNDQMLISEIIVVDDGSDDGSIELIEQYRHLPINVMTNSGRGVSAARNTGLLAAKNRWIQFLDADDLPINSKFARQLNIAMQTNADVVYGCWQIYQEDKNGIFMPERVVVPDYSGDIIAQLLASDNFCQIGAMLFNREAVLAVGGFDVTMQCIEDINLYIRLASEDVKFVKDNSLVVSLLHRKHQSFLSLSRKNSSEFYNGCLKNTVLAQSIWEKQEGGLSKEREFTLLQTYGNIARFFFERDQVKFNEVLGRINKIQPKYIPHAPRVLRQLSRLVGYKNAEAIALKYRQLKQKLWLQK